MVFRKTLTAGMIGTVVFFNAIVVGILPLPASNSGAYFWENLSREEFGFSVPIPAQWRKNVLEDDNKLRLDFFQSAKVFIVLEAYTDFEKDYDLFRREVIRNQKLKFHDLNILINRSLENGYSEQGKSADKSLDKDSYLLVSRFFYKGEFYLQRTLFRKSAKQLYVLNYISPERSYFKYAYVYNRMTSRIKIFPAQGKKNHDKENDNAKESLKDQIDKDFTTLQEKDKDTDKEKPAADLKIDKEEPVVQLEYTYLKDGTWGYCSAQKPYKDLERYVKRAFADGSEGYCLKEQ